MPDFQNLRAHHLAAALALLAVVLGGTPLLAADDPSIQGELRQGIQRAMQDFIDERTVDGTFRIYDPVSDQVRALRLQKLHSGIVQNGDFYLSCADFVDAGGDVLAGRAPER